jgi:hypothetical protein
MKATHKHAQYMTKLPTRNERIKRLCLYTRNTLRQLYIAIGLPANSSLFSKTRDRQTMAVKTAERIITAFPEISYQWLIKGEGEMLTERQSSPIYHKMKLVVNKINEMESKINFVYNLKK